MRPDSANRPRLAAALTPPAARARRGAPAALALLLLFGACASPAPVPLNRQGIPGTRVSLVVPDGFAVSDRFPGLMGEDAGSLVRVSEIPGPIDEIRAEMTADGLAARGMELLRSEKVTVDGHEGLLVHVRQMAAGPDLGRWIVVFGTADASVMIAASARQPFEDPLGETLRRILLSAKWNSEEIFDPYAGLGFALTEAGSLKISDRLPNMISFTRGGHRGALESNEPLFLAGSSLAPLAVTDLEDFAHRRLDEVAELEEPKILSEGSLELGGLPGYELVVAANDRRTGMPLQVYQALVVDADRFFLMQGLVGAGSAEEFIPQFREIAHSFRRTP